MSCSSSIFLRQSGSIHSCAQSHAPLLNIATPRQSSGGYALTTRTSGEATFASAPCAVRFHFTTPLFCKVAFLVYLKDHITVYQCMQLCGTAGSLIDPFIPHQRGDPNSAAASLRFFMFAAHQAAPVTHHYGILSFSSLCSHSHTPNSMSTLSKSTKNTATR